MVRDYVRRRRNYKTQKKEKKRRRNTITESKKENELKTSFFTLLTVYKSTFSPGVTLSTPKPDFFLCDRGFDLRTSTLLKSRGVELG